MEFIDDNVNLTVYELLGSILEGGNTTVKVSLDPLFNILAESNVLEDEIVWPYEAVEGFDSPNGKFPNTLGNVALIDCHYVTLNFITMLDRIFDRIESENIMLYMLARGFKQEALRILENISLCDYGLQIEGLLKDSYSYYMNEDDSYKKISQQGSKIVEAIGLSTSSSISTPLYD